MRIVVLPIFTHVNQMSITETFLQAVRQTAMLEWFAVLSGIAYVLFAAYQKKICWLFGLISSGLYVWITYHSLLFIDSWLQVFYVAMAIFGWLSWNQKTNRKLVTLKWQFHVGFLCLGILFTLLVGYLFDHYTLQASSYLDAAITGFSIVATFMTAKRILENWIYWIIIDASAVFLYGSRDLYLTSLLYFVFTLMAIFALVQWVKNYNSQNATP